jgi:hypothetical protein
MKVYRMPAVEGLIRRKEERQARKEEVASIKK